MPSDADDRVRRLLTPDEARPPFFVGVNLGGTAIKVGVIDDLGRPLGALSVPTEVAGGPETGVRRIGLAVDQAISQAGLARGQIAAFGCGAPGGLDHSAGRLLAPANLPGWWDFPIRDRLSQVCGLPVTCANDGTAAGYGEFWVGSGRSLRSMVLFTWGTGVGGAIILGDLSVEGDHGLGAELGHTTIDYNENARLCACGQRGHLEAYAGGGAVIRRTAERLAAHEPSTLGERTMAGEMLSPLMVAQEAARGDCLALEIVLDTARYLAIGIVNAMHTIDPSGVVLGGAMTFGGRGTDLGERFLARVRAEVRQRALPALAERTTIEFAALGADAGYIGAAGLARLALRSRPESVFPGGER